MAKLTKENSLNVSVWKNAILTFLKILVFCVILCFYVVAVLFFVYPYANVKLFRFMGLKSAEEASLVQVYNQSESDADLYNLIVFEQEQSSFEKELYYINLLTNSESYNEFCDKLDLSSLNAVGEDKTLIPYICNTRSYLNNQKVLCLVNMNQTVDTFIHSSLSGDYLFEYSYTTYLEQVYTSNRTIEEKQELINRLYQTYSLDDAGVTIIELIANRINNLEQYIQNEENEAKIIIASHTLMNMRRGEYISSIIINGENDELTIQAREVYQTALSNYNNLF